MEDLDLDNLLDELDDYVVHAPVTEDPKEVKEVKETKEDSIASQNVVDGDINAQPRAKNGTKTAEADPGVQYSTDFLEVQVETKKYMQDYFDIETEMREVKERMKNLKDEAKEIGVPVTAVAKAVKEMIKEIKETPDEAKNIEEVKRFIQEDDFLYSEVNAQAQTS